MSEPFRTRSMDLDTLHLAPGGHSNIDAGACLLEATAWFAGESFSDKPSCVSPVLRAYGIGLNDQFDDDRRQELKPFIPRLIGTAGDGLDEARSYLALDWLIRTYTPAFLDLSPELADVAAELRGLRRIVDMAAAEAAGPVVRAASVKASAAWSAAGSAAESAAWSAAESAAGSAAGSAARSAAESAAGSAAWSAARSAAESAAGSAAWSALQAAVDHLQSSAIVLFDQMIDPALVSL